MYCTNCGNELRRKAKFCTKCGAEIKKKAGTAKAKKENGKEEIEVSKGKGHTLIKWRIICSLVVVTLLWVGSYKAVSYLKDILAERSVQHTESGAGELDLTLNNTVERGMSDVSLRESEDSVVEDSSINVSKDVMEENIITEYDEILYEDSDYTIVAKKVSGFEEVTVQIGVLNGKKTKWLHELTDDHIFLKKDGWGRSAVYVDTKDSQYSLTYGQIVHNKVRYVGEGMFVTRAGISSNSSHTYLVFYNVYENTGFMIDGAPITYSYFGNEALGRNCLLRFDGGKAIVVDADDVILSVDTYGNVKKTTVGADYGESLGKYSCGLFFCGDGFYDASGGRIISLSRYKDQIHEYYGTYKGPYFESGEESVKVYMKGADEEVYYMEVKHSGEFVTKEPVKAN